MAIFNTARFKRRSSCFCSRFEPMQFHNAVNSWSFSFIKCELPFPNLTGHLLSILQNLSCKIIGESYCSIQEFILFTSHSLLAFIEVLCTSWLLLCYGSNIRNFRERNKTLFIVLRHKLTSEENYSPGWYLEVFLRFHWNINWRKDAFGLVLGSMCRLTDSLVSLRTEWMLMRFSYFYIRYHISVELPLACLIYLIYPVEESYM